MRLCEYFSCTKTASRMALVCRDWRAAVGQATPEAVRDLLVNAADEAASAGAPEQASGVRRRIGYGAREGPTASSLLEQVQVLLHARIPRLPPPGRDRAVHELEALLLSICAAIFNMRSAHALSHGSRNAAEVAERMFLLPMCRVGAGSLLMTLQPCMLLLAHTARANDML